jgi:uncharacterized phage protein gp47/JayE
LTLPAVAEAAYPTHEEFRDGILRTIRYAAARRGLEINVAPLSDAYIRADAVARRLAVAIANNKIALREFSPLTATGANLRSLCALFGVTERPASKSAGYVVVRGTGSWSIPSGYVATAPSGLKYETVSTSLAVVDRTSIQLRSIAAGADTNLDPETVLTWDSAAVGAMKSTCTVDASGFEGGRAADDDETLRARLIDRIAFAAGGGNWAQAKIWAEEASASVDKAYIYPCARGPASVDIAVVGATGNGSLSSAITAAVQAYVESQYPGHSSISVTSVYVEEVDVVLSATLPLPAQAGGAGGGWRDVTPYPAEDVKVTGYSAVTGVASVNGSTAPTVGASIAIWDPTYTADDGTTGKLREYTIATVSGVGPWNITVLDGFGFTPTNAFVSAGAVNMASYFATLIEQFREIGPGEKSSNVDILPFARRRPGPDVLGATDLTNVLLGPTLTAHAELLELKYAARYATGTSTPQTSPSMPPTTSDPPRRLVVKHLAIRKA